MTSHEDKIAKAEAKIAKAEAKIESHRQVKAFAREIAANPELLSTFANTIVTELRHLPDETVHSIHNTVGGLLMMTKGCSQSRGQAADRRRELEAKRQARSEALRAHEDRMRQQMLARRQDREARQAKEQALIDEEAQWIGE